MLINNLHKFARNRMEEEVRNPFKRYGDWRSADEDEEKEDEAEMRIEKEAEERAEAEAEQQVVSDVLNHLAKHKITTVTFTDLVAQDEQNK